MYEDNVVGKITDERFEKLTATYETEQKQLREKATKLKSGITEIKDESESVEKFLGLAHKYIEINEINAELLRTFIEKIIVYEAEEIDGERKQQIKIIYNCVGAVTLPKTISISARTKKVEAA